jgi:hypothetical protein
MAVKDGWTGRVFEDFEVGDIYPHPLGRTVLPVDNSWFTLLTQNINPIHVDRAYAEQTEFKQPLVDSTFTLALVTGQSTFDLSFNVMANLGWDEVRLLNPLFEGDTVYSRKLGHLDASHRMANQVCGPDLQAIPNVQYVRRERGLIVATGRLGRSRHTSSSQRPTRYTAVALLR